MNENYNVIKEYMNPDKSIFSSEQQTFIYLLDDLIYKINNKEHWVRISYVDWETFSNLINDINENQLEPKKIWINVFEKCLNKLVEEFNKFKNSTEENSYINGEEKEEIIQYWTQLIVSIRNYLEKTQKVNK